jgi:hypothetical protein
MTLLLRAVFDRKVLAGFFGGILATNLFILSQKPSIVRRCKSAI